MTEPQFYKRPSGLTVAEIATLVKAEPTPGLGSIAASQISRRSIKQVLPI